MSEDISSTTKYVEGFEDETLFNWMSRSNRTLQSDEVVKILRAQFTSMKVLLFMKKSDSEGSDYYYLGQVDPISADAQQTTIDGKAVVEIPLKLKEPLSEEIYNYLTAPVLVDVE